MKKVLLGTTAAAAIAMAGAAQAAEPLKLGISGYFFGLGLYVDQDNDATDRHDFQLWREGEVHFKGSTKLDNGITVGVDVQLEAESCGDQIDESYAWFEGGFGKVIFGAEDTAAYLLTVQGPTGEFLVLGADPSLYPLVLTNTAPLSAQAQAQGDAEKLTYLTPRFAGFQAGASYTPVVGCEYQGSGAMTVVDTDQDGIIEAGEGVTTAAGACGSQLGGSFPAPKGAFDDAYAVGVNYSGEFSGVKVALSGGYELLNRTTKTAAQDDQKTWNVGAKFGYAGFEFGGIYLDDNQGETGNNDHTAWQAGLTYATGPYKVGVDYFKGKDDGTDDETTRWGVGGSYTMGPGIDLRGSVAFYDLDSNVQARKNDATVISAGTIIFF